MPMNAYYPELILELRVSTQLEKLGSVHEAGVSTQVLLKNAELADTLVNRMLKISGASLLGKEDAAIKMAELAMDLRDSHEIAGQKLAMAPESVVEGLKKLSTAVFVDQVYSDTLKTMSKGAAYDDTRTEQVLGREYIVDIVRGLLT